MTGPDRLRETATPDPRVPHPFDLDPDQPPYAPQGGYCRCGGSVNTRAHGEGEEPADIGKHCTCLPGLCLGGECGACAGLGECYLQQEVTP